MPNHKKLFIIIATITLLISALSGCANRTEMADTSGLVPSGSMKLSYATEFSVDYFEGGYKLVTLKDGSRFLLIPEGAVKPEGLSSDIVPLFMPIKDIYLCATSSMCLFDALGRLDAIRFSGTKQDGWYIKNASKAMKEGRIIYAGKYSEPDYEMLISSGCPLAIESMMIGHASEVREQLERLGIAVLTDQSSNEEHPLGRAEWIKLYGALLDEEKKAEEIFRRQADILDEVSNMEHSGRTVAFFYISSNGRVIARKTGDYVSRMIDLAGGKYVFEDLGDPSSRTSTVTIEMETFYKTARDADVLIYNSAIAGEIGTLDELVSKHPLMREFKAVKNGNVWCTEKSMYQETTELGEMIRSLNLIFGDIGQNLDEVPFFYRLP